MFLPWEDTRRLVKLLDLRHPLGEGLHLSPQTFYRQSVEDAPALHKLQHYLSRGAYRRRRKRFGQCFRRRSLRRLRRDPIQRAFYLGNIRAHSVFVTPPLRQHRHQHLVRCLLLNAGVTTTVDTSQVSHTPAHSDACITGLKESGRRAVYTYSPGLGPGSQYPKDLLRLKTQYFSSTDQLLTLELNAAPNADNWALARQASVPIICHIVGDRSGNFEAIGKAGLMGPDNEYIHCTQLDETHWKMITDTGGKVSIAPAIEMQMRHGMPPLQAALDHGIQPSLSVDVECNMTADMFSIMRATFTLQRALVNERTLAGEQNLPPLVSCREVIEMATIGGARAAHLDHKIGTLSPGKEADIVMLAADRINVFPLNNVPGTVVTLMDTSNVETVFVAGKIVKWRGSSSASISAGC